MTNKLDLKSDIRTSQVISIVDISFVYNSSRTVVISQISGSEMVIPQPDDYANYTIVNGRREYHILYDWIIGDNRIPLLVPSSDTSYNASYCSINIPSSQTIINFDEQHQQSMYTTFTLNSQKPLYFKASTIENSIKKDVYLDYTCTFNSSGIYAHNIDFTVANADVQAGGQKTYDVALTIYKDVIFSKCLGTITISVKVVSTVGPGE